MKNLKNYLAEKSLLKNLPANPGVYIFKTSDYQPIYVGKAKNLKNRLTSYFFIQLLPKTRAMVGEAKYISYIPVASEFEAFLLEANLVRKLMPKYNIQLKDDKTPLYIIISKEEFPRVITARKTDLAKIKAKKIFGPYLSSLVVKKVISRLRRVFPHSSHKLGKRACIYSQIGLCVPCPNEIIKKEGFERNKLKKEYLKNIANLSKVLEGKHKSVLKDLERKMKAEAKNENFEAAGIYKNQIRQLNYLSQPRQDSSSYLENPSLVEDLRKKELKATKNLLNKYFQIKSLDRIECFDIAHLAGSHPTASMVTFTQGEPDKRLYRHFKVKTKLKGDTDRLKEILERRMKRLEGWGTPDLIIIDGGKGQISAVTGAVPKDMPVVGLAKRYETLVVMQSDKDTQGKIFIEERLKPPALYLFQRLRDESHRFARRLHHKQISKIFDNK